MTTTEAKFGFQMSVDRIKRILDRTPDERLTWSPAPTARTPLAQVVHAATLIHNIHTAMMGTRFATPTREEADAEFIAFEKTITTREEALALLKKNSQAFIDWLDELRAEKLSHGPPPIRSWRSADGVHARRPGVAHERSRRADGLHSDLLRRSSLELN